MDGGGAPKTEGWVRSLPLGELDDGVGGADTTMYGEPAGGFVRSVFLQDPEGNYVQLDQRA